MLKEFEDDDLNYSWLDNEEYWALGYHIDIKGKQHSLRNMSDNHLINTINYFIGWNTQPLLKEAKRRKLKIL